MKREQMSSNTTKQAPKRWLTIDEVAEEYGFSSIKQKRMRYLKLIPFSRVGNNVRYDRLLLDKWLEENRKA